VPAIQHPDPSRAHPARPRPARRLHHAEAPHLLAYDRATEPCPDRIPRELVFVADLTVELRAWPRDTWSKVEVDPQAAAHAVIGCW
jgi:hypothetical protein